jgi:hypothetical protein
MRKRGEGALSWARAESGLGTKAQRHKGRKIKKLKKFFLT